MASEGAVEPIDVLEGGCLRLTQGWPFLPLDQVCFQGSEERLDGGVIVAIAFATHR